MWEAHNCRLGGDPKALKFCLEDEKAAKSLHIEVEVFNMMNAPDRPSGIIRLLDTFLNHQPPFLVYELIRGGDLTGLIADWHATGRRPTPEQVASVMLTLAEIIGYAHSRGVVHRDLKPAHILIEKSADATLHFKIADFGIGGWMRKKAVQMERAETRGGFLSTSLRGSHSATYAPPEQKQGDNPDPRHDVYALGVIWYQLQTGDLQNGLAYANWDQILYEKGITREQVEVLARCTSSPNLRFENASVLACQIREVFFPAPKMNAPPEVTLQEEKVPSATTRENIRTPWWKRRSIAAFVAVVVVAGLFSGTVIAARSIYYQHAYRSYQRGDYDQAIHYYNEVLRLFPWDTSAYLYRGCMRAWKQEYDQAINDYTQAIALNPSFPKSYLYRGNSYLWEDEYDQATEDFTQAIALTPHDPESYMQRAKAHWWNGDYEKAIGDYREVVTGMPYAPVEIRTEAESNLRDLGADMRN